MKSLGVRSIAGRLDPGSSPRLAAPGMTAAGGLRRGDALRFTYSHIPSRPPSRPKPDSRYPPNPDDASKRLVEFTHTTPALIFGAMSSARLMLSVQTLAARPYGVLLASATDSARVRKVIVTNTGPKISTCAIVDEGETSVNNAGG